MTKAGAQMGQGVHARVIEIIATATFVPVERLSASARPEDLGIDSLGLVESIFALEEAFDIKVPFGSSQPNLPPLDVSTIGAIVAGVAALVQEAKAA
jgi:acyl carrier protein